MLASSSIKRVNVLGVGISRVNLSTAVTEIQTFFREPKMLGYVTVTGVHGVMESLRDAELQRIHNRSYLSTPDGMPMVWMAKVNGFEECDRVYGPDLMLEICRTGTSDRLRHFLFGGGEGVVDVLEKKLKGKFSQIEIVGKVTPPFRPLTEEEELELVAQIRQTKPHCVWVGLSTPKQERFMAGFLQRYAERLRMDDQSTLFFGVGAAFDFHAGLVRQAPRWMQRSGLEWLFRLCIEPKRLWRRYLYNNPRFLIGVFQQLSGLREFPLVGSEDRNT